MNLKEDYDKDCFFKLNGFLNNSYKTIDLFGYFTKEPGSSDILMQFYTEGSIEWR